MSPFDGSLASWTALIALLCGGAGIGVVGLRCSMPPLSAAGAITCALGLAWTAMPALAADDHESLVRAAQARGRAAEEALRSWTAEVSRRGARYEAEAGDLARANAVRLNEGLGHIARTDIATPVRATGVVYVAVSFSMEPQALRALAEEARGAGAVLVVRGFVGGSAPRTLAAAAKVFDANTVAGLAIDPQVFRAFQVTRAPTFISASEPVAPCDGGVNCTSRAPAHDRVSGNISLAQALRLLSDGGQDAPSAALAALAALDRLER